MTEEPKTYPFHEYRAALQEWRKIKPRCGPRPPLNRREKIEIAFFLAGVAAFSGLMFFLLAPSPGTAPTARDLELRAACQGRLSQ